MHPKPLHDSSPTLVRDENGHSHDLLLALSRAAQSIQQARTAEDFYRAVGNEIKSLGGEATLLLVNHESRTLSIAYTSYSPNLIRKAEKITGLSLHEYQIPFSAETVYGRAIKGRNAVFIESVRQAMLEIIPTAIGLFADVLMSMFKLEHGILAPLLVEDKTLGLLKINGTFLSRSDVSAMDVFAAQIATGLSNIRLVQKLQDELYARQKAEESLHRSRKTLLALGQAAQAIQKTHTPEDIYRVVGEQIKALGLEATILTLNSNRQMLCHSYTTLSTDIIQNAEKMAKVSARGYCWQIDQNGTYNRIISAGKSEFIHKSEELFAEALPKFMRPMTRALMGILKIGQGIIAPLRVDEEDLGLLVVFGNDTISEEDSPAIDSFAGQVAISLRNANLAKKVETEFLQKKQAEEAVRRAKEHFEALIEKAPDGITLLGMDGRVKYASPSARRLFDYSEEDITNLTPMEFIHPDDLTLVLETMNKLVQNPAYTPTIQYRYQRKDGVYYWVESTFSNLLADPNVEAMVINFHDITQRKLVEKALFESEKYYRALIENASDGILVVDEEGKISYESPSVTRMLGYEPYSLLGTNAFELIHPDDMAAIIEAFTQGSSTPNFVHRGEYRLIRKNGEWGYFEIVSHYLLNDPAIKGIVINGHDITERKQTEIALQESEARWQFALEGPGDGLWDWNVESQQVFFSRRLKTMLGYDETENWNALHEWDSRLHPDDRESVYQSLNLHFENKTPHYQTEHRLLCKDGTYKWILDRGKVTEWTKEQKPRRMIGTHTDITERKQVEQALKTSEERYRALYENIPSMYFTADSEGRIISINKFGVEKLGYSETELKDHPLLEVFHPDDHAMIQEQFAACLHHVGQMVQMEARKIQKDGTILWVRESARAVYDAHDQLVVLLTCDDITESKKAEAALQASEQKSNALYRMVRLMTDNLPDLVWAKDMDGRYLFANKSIVEKLLVATDTDEPLGQTDLYFAQRQRNAHPENHTWHTFGELCVNSDMVIHASQQAQRFEEFGNVKGEFLFLDVYKAPFLDENGNMIGTVGIGRDVTHEKKLAEEHQRAQQALAASEAELRALFSSMQDTVLVIKRDGTYSKIAPTRPGKFYIPPELVVGKHLKEFFPQKWVDIFFDIIEKVLTTKLTQHIEYSININGETPWFEASISPMGEDATLWVARDISERKQVEAKLYLQSAALEAVANTVVITDRNGLIEWVNSSFKTLTGFEPNEVIGKNPGELVKSGMHNKDFYRELWETILSGNVWHNELMNRRKDGGLYFEEMTITPLKNSQNEISHFIAVKQDITKRKKAENDLMQSEQAYRTLFENMPIGLYRTLASGEILDANPALVRMFGYPDRATLLQQKSKDMYAASDADQKFKEAIRQNGALSGYESEFRRYDNTIFWAEDYVHIINDHDGNPLYYEGSLIDITERRHAEDELRRANRNLETTHRELQQMLAHEQVLARTDGLTGLYNRRYFFELAIREFNISARYQHKLTIILFDVDGFKLANDTFGHDLGDRILAQIAQVAAAQIRDVDILARYGGDEFIILLPQTDTKLAFLVAERIRANVSAISMETENNVSLSVTLSMGIAEMKVFPQDKSIEEVIRHADQALYMAKKNGRNHVYIYSEE